MKPKSQRIHCFDKRMHYVAIPLILFLVIIGCRRSGDEITGQDEFTVADAKEWYYGIFKKSPNWSSSPLHGKKLPDWKNGVYKKIGSLEILEFPLITARKQIFILSTETVTIAEKRRITEASLSKISFIRNGSKVIDIRETYYIPGLAYLQQHRYDISHVSLLNEKNNFTGQVVVKNWKGDVVSIKQMSNGKIFRTLKLKNNTADAHVDQPSISTNDCFGAEDTWECIFEEVCTVTTYAEGIQIEQCEWVNTGVCWPVECIDDPDPCDGLTEEQCACEVYGICEDDDGGGDQQQCQQQCVSNSTSLSDGAVTTFKLVDEGVSPINNITKWKKPRWICLKSATWALESQEEGQVELLSASENRWGWKFIEHKSISFTGTSYGGTVSPSQGEGTPSFVAGTANVLYAGMEVAFYVNYTPVCKCPVIDIFIPPYTIHYKANAIFSAKP